MERLSLRGFRFSRTGLPQMPHASAEILRKHASMAIRWDWRHLKKVTTWTSIKSSILNFWKPGTPLCGRGGRQLTPSSSFHYWGYRWTPTCACRENSPSWFQATKDSFAQKKLKWSSVTVEWHGTSMSSSHPGPGWNSSGLRPPKGMCTDPAMEEEQLARRELRVHISIPHYGLWGTCQTTTFHPTRRQGRSYCLRRNFC